jgi:hypothetical protein
MESKIEKFVVPSGDWFQIEGLNLGGERGIEYIMSRIIGWAVFEQYVEAITASGYRSDRDGSPIFNVHGDDLSPTGKTWKEIFNSSPTNGRHDLESKEVTSVIRSIQEAATVEKST